MRIKLIFIGLVFLACSKSEPSTGSDNIQMTIDSYSAAEGNSNTDFTFRVRLSGASQSSVTVDYMIEDVTAVGGQDYVAGDGSLTFVAGETSKNIIVQILGDNLKEEDEQFRVIISNAVGATISNGSAIGTIENDDQSEGTTGDGYVTPLEYEGYTLVWNDEFNDGQIDLDNWRFEEGATGWGNNELQNYTTNNAKVDDGLLVIEAREEDGGYTSTRMITADKQEFAFGRVDIRAKLPEGQGIWPALWMLGANFFDVGWPYCGEIDIMELIGREPSKVHGTAHWGEQGWSFSRNKGAAYTLKGGAKFSDEFHVFSIVWEQNSIKWYVDDEEYFQLTETDVAELNYPFNQEFFFLFNIAVGGNWPGYPDETTVFPQRMYVDYIRVFQE